MWSREFHMWQPAISEHVVSWQYPMWRFNTVSKNNLYLSLWMILRPTLFPLVTLGESVTIKTINSSWLDFNSCSCTVHKTRDYLENWTRDSHLNFKNQGKKLFVFIHYRFSSNVLAMLPLPSQRWTLRPNLM